MKRGASFVIVGLAVMAVVALAPTAALAGRSAARSGGGRGGGAPIAGGHFGGPHLGGGHVAAARFAGPHVGGHPGVRQFAGRHSFHPRPVGRHFVPVTVFGAAPLMYYAPPVAYGATTYDAPPVYGELPNVYNPAAGGAISLAPSPAATSTPNVVHYATGRYELRGDGVTTPYTWVWIPNPPPAPPAPPATSEPDDPRPSRRSKLYRWTDEQGVMHVTDVRDAVPQAYRERE